MKIKILVISVAAITLVSAKAIVFHEGKAEHKSFNAPEEVRDIPLGKIELVKLNGAMLGRATLQPGWRWSTSVKPTAKTNSCKAPHFNIMQAAHLEFRWTMEPHLTARQAMFHHYQWGMMHG